MTDFMRLRRLIHLLLDIELLQIEYADRPDRLSAEVAKAISEYSPADNIAPTGK